MGEYNKNEKLAFYNQSKLDASKIWLLFLLLGWSYGSMGQMGKQILYYLTIGGLGIWAIYRLFTLNGKVKKYNRDIALRVGLDATDLLKLGI